MPRKCGISFALKAYNIPYKHFTGWGCGRFACLRSLICSRRRYSENNSYFIKDIVGFKRMMAHSEAVRLPTFRSCREIMDNLFQEHGGRIFNTGEDPVLAEFQPVQQVWG